jgi:hypothetical protein
MNWQPASLDWVTSHLKAELLTLDPISRARLEAHLVTPRLVPVESHAGDNVVVVGEIDGKVLYWSDIEDGWELDQLTPSLGIAGRGSNQYTLSHIARHVFGGPLDAG